MAKYNDGLDRYHDDLTRGNLNDSEYGWEGDPTVQAIREYEEQQRVEEEQKAIEEDLQK